MQETLKLMKQIITEKEKETNEKELINQYKKELCPNILAYFYVNNFGVIYNSSKLYSLLSTEDIASFCLQELDKCLQNYDIDTNIKFITYFMKCFKNRLRTESESLLVAKRKIILNVLDIDQMENSLLTEYQSEDINIILSQYNLTDIEMKQCKLLNMGYSLKEIALILKQAPITIYKRNSRIKEKFLKLDINFT